MLKVWEGPTVS